jgi:nucleoside 2-deoxyribosyltransferase
MIYLAGPVTGHPDYRTRFHEAAQALRKAGWAVWSPPEHFAADAPWAAVMRICLGVLVTCEGVAVLDGWEASRGASLEVQVAQACAIPVRPWRAWAAMRPPGDRAAWRVLEGSAG